MTAKAGASLVASWHGAEVFRASWAELADVVEASGGVDALVVDPPFSAVTHEGHREGKVIADRAARWGKGAAAEHAAPKAARDPKQKERERRYAAKGRAERRDLSYAHWSDVDMIKFLRRWVPLTGGWVCVLTDHVLAPVVEGELAAQKRNVFPPIPCIDPGGRVRMAGDGPSSNTTWLIVARPRGKPWSKWGTRRGFYVVPPGYNDRGKKLKERLPGGKTEWLMRAIVEDYSRPGDLVCDPCAGRGTTLRAALETGRRAVGGELDPRTAELCARYLKRPLQGLLIDPRRAPAPQPQQARLFEP